MTIKEIDLNTVLDNKKEEISPFTSSTEVKIFFNVFNAQALEPYSRYLLQRVQLSPPIKFKNFRDIHCLLHRYLGVHFNEHSTQFRVFASAAKKLSVVLKQNGKDLEKFPMVKLASGIWELTVPRLLKDLAYEYEITTSTGLTKRKADPISFQLEHYPSPFHHETSLTFDQIESKSFRHDTYITSPADYQWNDHEWLKERHTLHLASKPLNIYEVLPSYWKKREGKYLNYREIAQELVKYCKEMGYTHVELMGILEYPNDLSWGYQVSNYFAPTSRHGSLQDFQYLVDTLHQNRIGVCLDFISAHFCIDAFSLGKFDGTALFEPSHPDMCMHPVWKTYQFAYEYLFVRDYLLSSARFWVEDMHIDVLRLDALSPIIYLDEGRQEHPWQRNHKGDNRHFSGRRFLKELNALMHTHFPDVLMIAEDSSEHEKTCKPLEMRGFGFDKKWGFRWHTTTLEYFKIPPEERPLHHQKIISSLHHALDPTVVTCISHDDVTHELGSLMQKMPGDVWRKFANARLLLSYMMTLPSTKLFFMGTEFAQSTPWDERLKTSFHHDQTLAATEWELLNHSLHQSFHQMTRELNHLYLQQPSLWVPNENSHQFLWIDAKDDKNCVVSFYRKAPNGKDLICVHHFGAEAVENYQLRFPTSDYFPQGPAVTTVKEIFNSDEQKYGGSGVLTTTPLLLRQANQTQGFTLRLAPLATQIFEIQLN